MSTITLTDLVGREVVSGSTAESLGKVKTLVLDRPASVVERLQVAGTKRNPELVEWRRIQSIGDDVVLVRSDDDVHESDSDADELYTRGEIDIVGSRVLDTHGFDRGTVSDLHIDATSGDVVAFLTDQGRIPAGRIRALGTYALVVDPE